MCYLTDGYPGFFHKHHKEVASVEKTIIVAPSSKAAELEVFHQASDNKPKKKVEDGQELPCVAGQVLSGLSMYSNLSKKSLLKNIKDTQVKFTLFVFLRFVSVTILTIFDSLEITILAKK